MVHVENKNSYFSRIKYTVKFCNKKEKFDFNQKPTRLGERACFDLTNMDYGFFF